MADLVVCAAHTGSRTLPARTDPPGSEPTLQVLIDTLIDIDLAFERECQELSRGTLDAASQYRMLTKLRDQHRQRRTPYVHELLARHEGARTRSTSPGQSTRVG
jgi:hypothetical protein